MAQILSLLEKYNLPTSLEQFQKSDKQTKLVVAAGAGNVTANCMM